MREMTVDFPLPDSPTNAMVYIDITKPCIKQTNKQTRLKKSIAAVIVLFLYIWEIQGENLEPRFC